MVKSKAKNAITVAPPTPIKVLIKLVLNRASIISAGLKGLTDKVKQAGSKTAGFGKGLGTKAKNLGKSSVGTVKKLNPFKKK